MKKIIATVLAMVMALALCTTAFAVDAIGTVYGADGAVIQGATATLVAAKKPTATVTGNVAYYTFNDAANLTGTYVITSKTDDGVAASVLTSKGKVYLKSADFVEYTVEATYVGQLQKKCVKLDDKVTGKYYTAKDTDGDVYYFTAKETPTVGDTFALAGTELVAIDTRATSLTKNHTWVAAAYDTDGISVTAYKCDTCDVVGKVVNFETYMAAKSADRDTFGTDYLVLSNNAAGTTTGTTSPKTFDAGIAMYVGMALTSVAGSAVVIGKKKEF